MSEFGEIRDRESQVQLASRLSEKSDLRLVRLAFWTVAICAELLQAWNARFSPSPDGTNYLDMAGAVLRGDWKDSVNGMWSPFYAWILAPFLALLRPTAYWESAVLQLVNFVGLLLAFRCFEFLFRALLEMREHSVPLGSEKGFPGETGWWVLGYGLFLSTILFVQSVTVTTPDVWIFAFTCLIVGLIARIRAGWAAWHFGLLGLALACAYLTKAFYFPLTFVFLLAAWQAAGISRQTLKQVAFAFLVFCLVAGPFVITLSRGKHRLTFSDVGALNYVLEVDQIPRPSFWRGENGTGVPVHPARQLSSRPLLYEFATPARGTYPPGFDWSYWMEGAKPRFNLRGQIRVLRHSVGTYFQIFLLQLEYSLPVLVLFFFPQDKSRWKAALYKYAYLWMPAFIACLAYSLIHVEDRYVAPFVLVLWISLFCCAFDAAAGIPRRVALALVFATISITGIRLAKFLASEVIVSASKQENVSWEISEQLRALGLQRGDKVSAIATPAGAYWAHLAGLTIVSEIPSGEQDFFWTTDPATQRNVFQLLAGTGARLVVTKDPPPAAIDRGWIPLGDTSYYAHTLPVQ